jgi:hypothetical protein
MKKVELKARGADQFAEFGAADPTDADAPEADRGTRLTLETATGKRLAELVLGGAALAGEPISYAGMTFPGTPDTQYVRFAGDDAVYLVDKYVEVGARANDWTEKGIFDFDEGDVVSVERTELDDEYRPTGAFKATRRPGGDEWSVERLEDSEKLNASRLNRALRSLAGLEASAVADPMKDLLEYGFPPVEVLRASLGNHVMVSTSDGTLYCVIFGGLAPEGGRYVLARAFFDAGARVEPEAKPAAEAPAGNEAPPAEAADEQQPAKIATPDEVKAMVERTNARVAPWVFLLSKYTTKDLAFKRADVVEKIEPTGESEGPAAE